jgi:phospholipid/cholesterol/gamma-HCH transport system substrate-binding protein
MKSDQTARQIRVGAFVLGGLLLLFALLFLLGRTQGLFVRRVGLATSFRNTAGLVVGAAVRLGGVDVGTVQAIEFSSNPAVKDVTVQLRMDARYLDRVRADSVARLAPKGLLGDMTIDISVGSADARALAAGATVASQESQGLAEVAATVHEGVAAVADLSRGLRQHVDSLLTPEVEQDWARMVHAGANVASAVEKSKGIAHAANAMAGIDRLVAAVESGNGNLHELLFENDVAPLLADARTAARDLADATAQIRAGHGPLHALVYGREGDALMKNLTDLSRVLRGLGDDLAQGKGTAGAFLQDPTIYEDLKIILRDIKRNQLLKALVRFTIKQDGLGTSAASVPGSPPTSRAGR